MAEINLTPDQIDLLVLLTEPFSTIRPCKKDIILFAFEVSYLDIPNYSNFRASLRSFYLPQEHLISTLEEARTENKRELAKVIAEYRDRTYVAFNTLKDLQLLIEVPFDDFKSYKLSSKGEEIVEKLARNPLPFFTYYEFEYFYKNNPVDLQTLLTDSDSRRREYAKRKLGIKTT